MAVVEGYPNGVWNRLQMPVPTTKDIVLTPARHTYMFQGWKDEIVNRMIAGAMFAVRGDQLDRFDMTGQGEWEELDRAYGWFDTAPGDRMERSAAAATGAATTAAAPSSRSTYLKPPAPRPGTPMRRASSPSPAYNRTARPSPAPAPVAPPPPSAPQRSKAALGGFAKGIHVGLFTTFETIPGTFLPQTKMPALGAGLAKNIIMGGIPGGEIVEHLKSAYEAIEKARDAHELVERLRGAHVYDNGKNWELMRRPIKHVDERKVSEVKNFFRTHTGMGEQKVIVVLSLLPGRNMMRIPVSGAVKLQIVANFLDSMDAVKG